VKICWRTERAFWETHLDTYIDLIRLFINVVEGKRKIVWKGNWNLRSWSKLRKCIKNSFNLNFKWWWNWTEWVYCSWQYIVSRSKHLIVKMRNRFINLSVLVDERQKKLVAWINRKDMTRQRKTLSRKTKSRIWSWDFNNGRWLLYLRWQMNKWHLPSWRDYLARVLARKENSITNNELYRLLWC